MEVAKAETHVKVEDGDIDVVEELAVVLDRLAAGEEDDDLLLKVLAKEGEEEEEALVRVADDVALLEVLGRRSLAVRIDVDVEGSGAERHASEIGNLGGLGRREEHRLAILCGKRSAVSYRASNVGRRVRAHPWEGDR